MHFWAQLAPPQARNWGGGQPPSVRDVGQPFDASRSGADVNGGGYLFLPLAGGLEAALPFPPVVVVVVPLVAFPFALPLPVVFVVPVPVAWEWPLVVPPALLPAPGEFAWVLVWPFVWVALWPCVAAFPFVALLPLFPWLALLPLGLLLV